MDELAGDELFDHRFAESGDIHGTASGVVFDPATDLRRAL